MNRLGWLAAVAVLCASPPARADFADHFARRTDVPFDKVPSRGHSRVLVLPVEVAGFPPFDLATLRAFFGPGGTFEQYYEVNSRGAFEVEAEVVDPVSYSSCPLPAAQFPNCAVERGDANALTPAVDVIRDALSKLDARGTDFTRFDLNGATGTPDGTIDGFLLLTNTPFGGIALPTFEFNSGDNLDGGTGGPFILDGVQVPYVAIAGSAQHRVLLHEFGHLLGFTDLYDEDDPFGGVDYSLMGNWDYDENPPLLDAESRYRIGWAPTVDVDHSATFHLAPAEQGGQILKLGRDPEYFLVENRGPGASTDRGMSKRGIAIFHVDRSVGPTGEQGGFVSRLLTCVECDEDHPYILTETRDGQFRWIARGGFAVDASELFEPGDSLRADPSGQPFSASHAASTNLYDGGMSGLAIAVTGASGDDFDVQVTMPADTPPCSAPPACPKGSVCPDEVCQAGPAGGAGASGCGCASGPDLPMLAVFALAALGLRRKLTSSC